MSRPTEIERSHFRARINYIPHRGEGYFFRCERRDNRGRWVTFWKFGDSDRFPIGEHDEAADAMNRIAQRRLNVEQVERAVAEHKRRQWGKNQRQAREEYRAFLNGIPVLTADRKKESPLATRYTGGPDGGVEPRSTAEWGDLYLRKHCPEWWSKAYEKKAELREKYDLPSRTTLY